MVRNQRKHWPLSKADALYLQAPGLWGLKSPRHEGLNLCNTQADLGDTVGSVPGDCNKVDIAIKQVTPIFLISQCI